MADFIELNEISPSAEGAPGSITPRLISVRFILMVTPSEKGCILSLAAGRLMHVQEDYEELKTLLGA